MSNVKYIALCVSVLNIIRCLNVNKKQLNLTAQRTADNIPSTTKKTATLIRALVDFRRNTFIYYLHAFKTNPRL